MYEWVKNGGVFEQLGRATVDWSRKLRFPKSMSDSSAAAQAGLEPIQYYIVSSSVLVHIPNLYSFCWLLRKAGLCRIKLKGSLEKKLLWGHF